MLVPPVLLRACAALDASMYLYVVSKVHTPSVTKLPDSKCFREAPVASFHLTSCSFVNLSISSVRQGNSTLHTFNTAPISSRGDYNSLTSDIFRSFWLNVRPLIHYLSNAMYGCLTKLVNLWLLMTFGRSFLQPYNLL